MNSELSNSQRRLVRIGAAFVLAGWTGFLLAFISTFASVALAKVGFGTASRFALASSLALMVVGMASAIAYLFIALTQKCPSCGFSFLKNPKGLGPTGLVYHSSCKKIRGFNPWSYQIYKAATTGNIRCVSCGVESRLA